MKITSITCLLLAFIATQSPLYVQADPPAPTLICTIEKPLNPPSGTPLSYNVSNLNFINLDILIDTKGGGSLEEIGTVAINPSGNLPPSYLVITATNSSGTSVPVKAKIRGGNGADGAQGYRVELYLPEDATTRASKEQAFIDHAKTTDTQSPAVAITWANQHNDQALSAIDSIYTQSRVGAITLTVKYVSTQPGLWNGTVQGAPIIANVENKGDQLDSLH